MGNEHTMQRGFKRKQKGDGVSEWLQILGNQTPAARIRLMMSGPRKHKTYRLEKYLDEHDGKRVTSLHVGRKPIISPVEKALNVLSFGGFSAAKKRLGYDNVFHEFVLAGLSDGSFHKIERNHVVEAFPAKNADFAVDDLLDVPVREDSTMDLNQMIDNAADNDPNFWHYRAGDRNCQVFARDVVKKNKLVPGAFDDDGFEPDAEALKVKEFLEPQDSKALLDSIPWPLAFFPNAVTDAAASLDRATSLVANGLGGSTFGFPSENLPLLPPKRGLKTRKGAKKNRHH